MPALERYTFAYHRERIEQAMDALLSDPQAALDRTEATYQAMSTEFTMRRGGAADRAVRRAALEQCTGRGLNMAVQTILVVGAGFAGATYARTLAEAGLTVHVIDRRDHIAGNAADAVDANGFACIATVRICSTPTWIMSSSGCSVSANGCRIGIACGRDYRMAGLFRCRSIATPSTRCSAKSLHSEAEVSAFLRRVSTRIDRPRNAGEYLRSQIGDVLTDLFFRPYTKKMWELELEDLDASVIKRLPIQLDVTDGYFPNDRHQFLPRDGYTAVVEQILRHPAITVATDTPFVSGMERDYDFCFNSMAIDEYFGCSLGELPYRSLRFHHRSVTEWDALPWSVRNYTDDGPLTRETWWHCLPGHLVEETGRRTMTTEEPCDYRDNGFERYYPVRTADQRHQTLYREYRELAEQLPGMVFIGRCGTYQYLDMDQVINQSLCRRAPLAGYAELAAGGAGPPAATSRMAARRPAAGASLDH